MKELKFRGLTKENKFVYGYYFLWKKRNKVLHMIGEGVQNGSIYGDEVDPETISQDTGLKDVYGKKIFEGEIVEIEFNDYYSNNSFTIDEDSTHKGEIVFKDFGYYIKFPDMCFMSINDVVDYDFNIKILRNIHQNSELLEINK